jgi:serine/threonine-protein kinase
MAEAQPLILEGEFRLLRRAGGGGTADVYLAERSDGSGEKVAVKVLKRTLAGQPEMVERFKREAGLLARIKHPNVVRVLRFEVAPEGTLLLLEWVEGRRLDEELDRQTLPGIEKLLVLRQVASALAAVHELGIVNRDLKPENVMLDRTGDTVQARLLDFGIARRVGKKHGDQFVTVAGVVAGTPSYLAPEQLLDRPPDARTDVYGFGVMAYLMVAGRLPFTGTDFEVMQLQLKAPPPAPAPLEPELAPLVPLVLRCLAKRPEGRPDDGAALGAELERALAGGPRRRRGFFSR